MTVNFEIKKMNQVQRNILAVKVSKKLIKHLTRQLKTTCFGSRVFLALENALR